MANTTKGNTLRLYVKDEDLEALSHLTEKLEITQTEIMSRIMTAGIRALKDNQYRMPLPLAFCVMTEDGPVKELAPVSRVSKARR